MKWLLDQSLRAKLYLGFGLIIVLLGGAMVTAQQNITAMAASQRTVFEVEFANSMDLARLESDLNAVRADMLTMTLLNERSEQEALRQEIVQRAEEITEGLERTLERARNDPQSLRRLEELRVTREAFQRTRDTEQIPLIFAGKLEEARALILGIQLERYQTIRSIADTLEEEAAQRAGAAVEQSEQRASESRRTFVIMASAFARIWSTLARTSPMGIA